jgi:LPXTG-site transpeptidase (sortase) family protein
LQGTPEMGQGGNFVLAGHVELKDGSRGPFADIHRLQPGDVITILSDTQPEPSVRAYLVTDLRKVQPQDFGVIRNHGYEELTLVTCDDWDIRTQAYASRVIVHARPQATLLRMTVTAQTRVPTRLQPTATRR